MFSAQPPRLLSFLGLKYHYFTYQGRLNRKRFILAQILLSILFVPLMISLAQGLDAIFMTTASPEGLRLPTPLANQTFKEGAGSTGLFMFCIALGYLLVSHALIVKRLHDMDWSGHVSWLLFLPILNFFIGLMLYLKRGTRGDNMYGPDPLAPYYYEHPQQAPKKKKSRPARDPHKPDDDNDSPTIIRRS